MTYEVKELYCVWEDNCGHKFTIAKDLWFGFQEHLENLEDASSCMSDEMFHALLDNLLEAFGATLIEGEEVYIVYPNDIVEG